MFESVLKRAIAKVNSRNMNKYFRTRIVMALDVLVSVVASVCTLLLVSMLLPGITFGNEFLITWFTGAFVATLISVGIAKSYRSIIRYTTLRELYPVALASIGKEVILLIILSAFCLGEHSFNMLGAMALADLPLTLSALIIVRIGNYSGIF